MTVPKFTREELEDRQQARSVLNPKTLTFEEIVQRFQQHRCSRFSSGNPTPDPVCPECQWLQDAFRAFAPDPETVTFESIQQQADLAEAHPHKCNAEGALCLRCLAGRWAKDGVRIKVPELR